MAKKVKFKIWMTVEKITTDEEEGMEDYEDIDDVTMSVTECDSLKEATDLMEDIHYIYSASL